MYSKETSGGRGVIEKYFFKNMSINSYGEIQILGKTTSLDFAKLREDVKKFLKPVEVASLNLWTWEFFLERAPKLFA